MTETRGKMLRSAGRLEDLAANRPELPALVLKHPVVARETTRRLAEMSQQTEIAALGFSALAGEIEDAFAAANAAECIDSSGDDCVRAQIIARCLTRIVDGLGIIKS